MLEHTEQMTKRGTCNSKKTQMQSLEFNNSITTSVSLCEIIHVHKERNPFHRMKTKIQDNRSWYARKMMMIIIITIKHSRREVTYMQP